MCQLAYRFEIDPEGTLLSINREVARGSLKGWGLCLQGEVKGKGKALARSWSSPGSNLLQEQIAPSLAAPSKNISTAVPAVPMDGESPFDTDTWPA